MACHSSDVCSSEFMEENNSFLDMELEALQSIYINELEVKMDEKFTTVSIDLYPSTADKLEEQYVRMTLQLILEEEYPEKIPDIKIRNPRGLSEEELNSVVQDLLSIAESKKGNSMLFEMIDAAKEHLTVGNRPSGECAICLHGFSDKDIFTKTECYHYFHSHCLARYAKNYFENAKEGEADAASKAEKDEQLLCPMCRVPIQYDDYDVDYPPPEESEESNFILSEELVELQKKMADLFQKQVEKGGIIDVEAEKNKYLLEISNVPTRANVEEKSDQKPVAEGESVPDSKVQTSDDVDSPINERKEHVQDHNKKFDYRGKNRFYNRSNDTKRNYRYDQRYNKQSYDSYRGNYNRGRYGKQNSGNSYRQREESDLSHQRTEHSSMAQNTTENEDLTNNSQDVLDNASVNSEHSSPDLKSRRNTNHSPRYNRGYHHRGHNYSNYRDNGRRSGSSNYHDHQNSQSSRRYSAIRAEESSPGKSEERDEDSSRTYDGNSRKTNYRSGNYKRDDDYHSRQRYSDSRNNSQSGYKGAYGRRENFSNSYNNYSRNSRYGDSKNEENYSDRNFREKRTYRDDKYRARGDSFYDRYRHGTKNYAYSRPGRYSDQSYEESSTKETDFTELSSRNQNNDSSLFPVESEGMEGPSIHHFDSSEKDDVPVREKNKASFSEGSGKLTAIAPAVEANESNTFPNVSEMSQAASRTVNPPPGFANPLKKVIYGLQGANPPPGFNRS